MIDKEITKPEKTDSDTPAKTKAKDGWVYLPYFVTFVGCSLLLLSLSHLASGIARETGDPWWQALALAIGLDLGVLAAELVWVVSHLRGYNGVRLPAGVVLVVTLVLSAVLNARTYTQDKEPWTFTYWLCIVLGVVIPLLVLCLAKMTAGMVIGAAGTVEEASAAIVPDVETDEAKREAWRLAQRFHRKEKKGAAGIGSRPQAGT